MRLRTLYLYLIGNREAILALASSRWTLALGALFVLSAGLARDYDGEDLLHGPWHLLVPFAASLAASFGLFVLAWWGCRWPKGAGPSFIRTYAAFLGLFWMTAPLAWFYAIPYERFLTPLGAVRANLITLGIVAAWRVALMVRVLIVAWNYRVWDAIFVVMAFGDCVALVAITFLPINLMDVMSGARGAASDVELRSVGCGVLQLGICSGVLLLPALVSTITSTTTKSSAPSWPQAAARPTVVFWGLALGSLLIWAPLLPGPQAEQQLRWKVESDFHEGRIGSAIAEMSAHAPNDFPPHWQPPPRYVSYYEWGKDAQLLAIWEVLLAEQPAPWVREVYLIKLRDFLRHARGISSDNAVKWVEVLTKLPETPMLIGELENELHDDFPDWLRVGLPKHLRLKDKDDNGLQK
jgi:hypothetical protein